MFPQCNDSAFSFLRARAFYGESILVLIFGGAGFVAKVLFASNKNNGDSKKNNKSVNEFKNDAKSIDDELDAMKKNIK